MARQPFLPTYKDTPTVMGPDMIETLPKIAELIGKITTNWSGVELHLALTLGSLLGVQSAAAVAVFLSLRNHRAQRDVLQAAADRTLMGEALTFFNALMNLHREYDKQRNDVVHCVWGRGDKTPDGVIWSSLQDHAAMLINDYHLAETGQLDAKQRPLQMTKDYFVVRYNDLETLNKDVIALCAAVRNFHSYIRYIDNPAGANAYKELVNEPLIKEALTKVAGQ